MRTAFFLVRRALTVLLVLVVVLVVGGIAVIAVSAFYQPVDGVVLLVMLGVLCGVVFLTWIVFKAFRRATRAAPQP